MRAHGVEWAETVLRMASDDEGCSVAAGFGCVATAKINAGDELFCIPFAACFGASCEEADGGAAAEEDSQKEMARLYLQERAKGRHSSWAPLLSVQSSAPCPWVWPANARAWLQGTELADVVALKLQRLEAERVTDRAGTGRKRAADDDGPPTASQYADACALVASHINPWYGSAIVPFNCMLNFARQPNVVFAAEGGEVVGRAERDIEAGEELTQEYADSTAELIYRYGFAPRDGVLLDEEAVSISLSALGEQAVASERAPGAAIPPHQAARGRQRARARSRVLCAAALAGPRTWDGLEGEITVEIQPGGRGTAQLIGAALALAADDAAWAAVAPALARAKKQSMQRRRAKPHAGDSSSDDDDGESDGDEDEVAAALVAALLRSDLRTAKALAAVARTQGGDDCDPWPALLRKASPSERIEAARAVATRAVEQRLATLERLPFPSCAPEGGATPTALQDCWQMASALRAVETCVLKEALDTLAVPLDDAASTLA